MNEVEQLIYQRMVRDTTATVGLLALLGSASDTTRVLHSHQVATPPSPGVTYGITTGLQGLLPGKTLELFVTFNIFAPNYSDIALRLKRLFDGHTHDLSLISGGAAQVGGVQSVFEFEGPDGFDDALETQKKDVRYRFFVKPKAQYPI